MIFLPIISHPRLCSYTMKLHSSKLMVNNNNKHSQHNNNFGLINKTAILNFVAAC